MKIVLIIGLPGSGKTHYAQNLAGPGTLIIDDCTKDDVICLPSSDSFHTIVIIDANFCIPGILNCALAFLNAHYGDPEIEMVWFENAPEKALNNIKHRNDGRKVTMFIQDNTATYDPPADARKIWQKS